MRETGHLTRTPGVCGLGEPWSADSQLRRRLLHDGIARVRPRRQREPPRERSSRAAKLSGVGSTCLPWGKGSDCLVQSPQVWGQVFAHDRFRVPQLDERQGDGRQAACLVGREAEVDRICAFAATARTDRRGRPGDRRARCRQDRAAGPTTATRHAGWGSLREHEAIHRRQPKGHDTRHRGSAAGRPRPALASRGPGGRLPNGRSTTPSPAEVARRYGLDADLAGALESIDTWTGAVVNR